MDAGLSVLTERIKSLAEERRTLLVRAEQVRGDMVALERAIAILQGVSDTPNAPARKMKEQESVDILPGVNRAALRKAILECLREAQQPVTTGQCIELVLKWLGLTHDGPRTVLSTTTHQVLTSAAKSGVIRQFRDSSNIFLWEVIR